MRRAADEAFESISVTEQDGRPYHVIGART
jgi:hypothetical protein